MASTSAFSMAMPLTSVSNRKQLSSSDVFLKPLPVLKPSMATARGNTVVVRASLKEKAVTGLTAAALTASLVIPEVAEAASGVSPSLKNFLLSIVAGGVVFSAIVGAVIGVSNFDPVKRA
ncbi:hypothetical protein HHK36_031838 [Tetracentron sinense]|uniref:Ultraviolet-B-repressible protein n=1 Tax=Tetracentron sinense TaxID=13715 RepID=A0A834Y8Z9_TETSI|nr:hypothetical protein HHK36_031838 [Tetracentron sinense]